MQPPSLQLRCQWPVTLLVVLAALAGAGALEHGFRVLGRGPSAAQPRRRKPNRAPSRPRAGLTFVAAEPSPLGELLRSTRAAGQGGWPPTGGGTTAGGAAPAPDQCSSCRRGSKGLAALTCHGSGAALLGRVTRLGLVGKLEPRAHAACLTRRHFTAAPPCFLQWFAGGPRACTRAWEYGLNRRCAVAKAPAPCCATPVWHSTHAGLVGAGGTCTPRSQQPTQHQRTVSSSLRYACTAPPTSPLAYPPPPNRTPHTPPLQSGDASLGPAELDYSAIRLAAPGSERLARLGGNGWPVVLGGAAAQRCACCRLCSAQNELPVRWRGCVAVTGQWAWACGATTCAVQQAHPRWPPLHPRHPCRATPADRGAAKVPAVEPPRARRRLPAVGPRRRHHHAGLPAECGGGRPSLVQRFV